MVSFTRKHAGDRIRPDDINEIQVAVEGMPDPGQVAEWQQTIDDLPDTVAQAAAAAVDADPTISALNATKTRYEAALVLDTAYGTLQEAMTAGAGGTVLVTTSQTVPVGLTVPANTRVLVSPGVVLTREQPSTGKWITISDQAILDGGEYDGNKANASGFSRAYIGIEVQAGGTLQNANVHDNNGHGVVGRAGARIINVQSDDHGDNPGGDGTGDGIYVANVEDVLLDQVAANGNARIGITITSTSGATSGTVRDAVATNNGYYDYDFEMLTDGEPVDVVAQRLRGGTMSASGAHLVLEDADITRIGSGTTHAADTDITIRRTTITLPTDERVEVYAARIVLDDVRISADRDTDTGWSAAFYSTGIGYASRVHLSGTVYNGLLFSVEASSGGRWDTIQDATVSVTAANRLMAVRIADDSAIRYGGNTTRFRVENGRYFRRGSAAPSGSDGTFAVGDVVETITPAASGVMGRVCVEAGSPGTWKTFGAIEA